MRKYQVYLIDENGAKSEIDIITAADDYTPAQYIRDCDSNADDDWCDMIHKGTIELYTVE